MFKFEYENRKGKVVTVESTAHSYKRFCQRYSNYYGKSFTKEELDQAFSELFDNALQEPNYGANKKLKKRAKKTGNSSIYFIDRSGVFRLVVQNGQLITVELRGKNKKFNNRRRRVDYYGEPEDLQTKPTFN